MTDALGEIIRSAFSKDELVWSVAQVGAEPFAEVPKGACARATGQARVSHATSAFAGAIIEEVRPNDVFAASWVLRDILTNTAPSFNEGDGKP